MAIPMTVLSKFWRMTLYHVFSSNNNHFLTYIITIESLSLTHTSIPQSASSNAGPSHRAKKKRDSKRPSPLPGPSPLPSCCTFPDMVERRCSSSVGRIGLNFNRRTVRRRVRVGGRVWSRRCRRGLWQRRCWLLIFVVSCLREGIGNIFTFSVRLLS